MRMKAGSKPFLNWQTGDYERFQKISFTLPMSFLLLCKICDVPPRQILIDFIDNLACGSWKRENRDKAKAILQEYFIECGYGQIFFTPEEITTMFHEMDAVGLLFPSNDAGELREIYLKWRELNEIHWFNKWFNKNQRKL